MSYRSLNLLFSGVCLLVGCKNNGVQTQSQVIVEDETITKPHAEFHISSPINLGEFSGDELKKQATISFSNMGNDTLYIIGAQPDCQCTEVQVLDTIIAPHGSGRMQVSLDLTEYPKDTIYKEIAVISNDLKDHVKRFQLMGIRK